MANGKQHAEDLKRKKETYKQTCPNCLGSKLDRLGNPCKYPGCGPDGRITITPK